METLPGCDPDRAGFTVALEAARDTVVSRSDLVEHIGARDLHALPPGRRMGRSARIVKYGSSRYTLWNRDGRPRDSTSVTAVEIARHPTVLPSTQDPSRASPAVGARSAGSWPRTPAQSMPARDIARDLGLPASALEPGRHRQQRPGLDHFG
ncbi:hypothetical protein [Streptomyces sp. AC550_RSS872]|uniref:hypothetical protein n=1 Tax=Streptomyces sp. AC550_RSS872 TaxID=2823689 RepID=UPI001C26BABA|nr:hypothetical protein [Streptomyces sp. AC550_RSS872]